MGSSKEEIQRAARALEEVALEWRWTLNIPNYKSKLLVAGRWSQGELQPITVRGEPIDAVTEFKYLGLVVESHREVVRDVEERIA